MVIPKKKSAACSWWLRIATHPQQVQVSDRHSDLGQLQKDRRFHQGTSSQGNLCHEQKKKCNIYIIQLNYLQMN